MTDKTLTPERGPDLPTAGGSYIRNADGSLSLVEAPTAEGYRLTARAAAAEAPVEEAVEGDVESPTAPHADPAPRQTVKRTGKDV